MKKQLLILSGFLGSGKTTFLLSLLAGLSGKRTAVLLNDFGDIPVDGAIVDRFSKGERVLVEIGGGSVFCSCLKGQFVKALFDMAETDAEVVIVEASGMSDPTAIDRMLALAGLTESYDLALTICLFDPIKSFKLGGILEVIPRQIKSADVVVLSKADIVSEEEVHRAQTWIRTVDLEVPMVLSGRGLVDWTLLPKRLHRQAALFGFNTPENRPDSLSFQSISGDLDRFLEALEKDDRVLRVKGFVKTAKGIWFVSDIGKGFEQWSAQHAPVPLTIICMQGTAEDVRRDLEKQFDAVIARRKTMSGILQEISENLQKGKMKDVPVLVKKALEEGLTPLTILNEGLMPGMDIIGERFKNNDIFIPEVLIAARAMSAGTDVLKPLLVGDQHQSKGTVVIGTIKNDLHDIGKNLVRMMMESKGLTVIDLGNSVAPQKYIDAAVKHNANIIACSALLTTTMTFMKDVVKGVADNPALAGKCKVMIGGAPVNQAFCDSIGADYYTPDASTAAELAVKICEGAA